MSSKMSAPINRLNICLPPGLSREKWGGPLKKYNPIIYDPYMDKIYLQGSKKSWWQIIVEKFRNK